MNRLPKFGEIDDLRRDDLPTVYMARTKDDGFKNMTDAWRDDFWVLQGLRVQGP